MPSEILGLDPGSQNKIDYFQSRREYLQYFLTTLCTRGLAWEQVEKNQLHDSVMEKQLLLDWTTSLSTRRGWGGGGDTLGGGWVISPASLPSLLNQSNTTCQIDLCAFIGYKSPRGKYVASCCHFHSRVGGWCWWCRLRDGHCQGLLRCLPARSKFSHLTQIHSSAHALTSAQTVTLVNWTSHSQRSSIPSYVLCVNIWTCSTIIRWQPWLFNK